MAARRSALAPSRAEAAARTTSLRWRCGNSSEPQMQTVACVGCSVADVIRRVTELGDAVIALDGCDMDASDTEYMQLFAFLGRTNARIASLDVSGIELELAGTRALAALVHSALPELQQLCMAGVHAEDAGLVELAEFLPDMRLTLLDLASNHITAAGAAVLAAALPRCPTLTSLELRRNRIGDEGAAALAGVLHVSALRVLSLKACGVGLDGASALLAALPTSRVRHINLGGVGELGREGGLALAQALPHTVLDTLYLGNARLGVAGLAPLVAVLSRCQLQKLDLMQNALRDDGVSALCAAITEARIPIVALSLRDNGFGDAVAPALVGLLDTCRTSLDSLDLADNNITATALGLLAERLPRTRLTTFSVFRNYRLTQAAVSALVAVLPRTCIVNCPIDHSIAKAATIDRANKECEFNKTATAAWWSPGLHASYAPTTREILVTVLVAARVRASRLQFLAASVLHHLLREIAANPRV